MNAKFRSIEAVPHDTGLPLTLQQLVDLRHRVEMAIFQAESAMKARCLTICEDIKKRWVNEGTADLIADAIRKIT